MESVMVDLDHRRSMQKQKMYQELNDENVGPKRIFGRRKGPTRGAEGEKEAWNPRKEVLQDRLKERGRKLCTNL
jgi:hypothetical protein